MWLLRCKPSSVMAGKVLHGLKQNPCHGVRFLGLAQTKELLYLASWKYKKNSVTLNLTLFVMSVLWSGLQCSSCFH